MDEYPGDVRLFINGSYVEGAGEGRQQVRSPVSGKVVGSVPVPVQADIDTAVAAANAAQRRWGRVGVWERAKVCHAIGDALTARCEQLARLQTLEQGKPLQESRDDIAEAATLFHLHAEDAVRLTGETIPSTDANKRMWTFYRPVGTWAIITPWNYPLLMFAEFVAPGLATGNAHVVKPPAHTAFSVLAAMDVLREAGVPEGLVNILPGEGATGEALITHPGIDAIGFIGSSATGAKIQAKAGLKRSIMECSGNGPLIVLGDADLQAAAKAAVYGAALCSGQVCCATERVLVERDVHNAFVDAVLTETDVVCLGDPFDARTRSVRLITKRSQRRWTGTWPMVTAAGPYFSEAASAGPGSRQTCTTSSPSPTGSRSTACTQPKSHSARSCRSSRLIPKTSCSTSPTVIRSACRRRCSLGTSARPTGSSKNSRWARWSSTTAPAGGTSTCRSAAPAAVALAGAGSAASIRCWE